MTTIKPDYSTALQEVREAIGAPVKGETITEMIQDLKRQYEQAYEDALSDIKSAGKFAVGIVQDIESSETSSEQVKTAAIKKLKKAFGLEPTLKQDDFVL